MASAEIQIKEISLHRQKQGKNPNKLQHTCILVIGWL